jgi:hypothetical protein
MYTLLELESKTFGELKKIGYELNVLPKGDRRCRQSWIDALVPPPLLQLLEASPAASVEQVQKSIEPMVEASPAASVEQVQEPIEVQAQEPPLESKFGRIVYLRPTHAIGQVAKTSPGAETVQTQSQTIMTNKKGTISQKYREAIKILPGFSGNHQDVVYRELQKNYRWDPKTKKWIYRVAQVAKTSPGVEVKPAQEPIIETVEATPGVDLDDELPECSNCFGDGYVEDEFGFVKFCCDTEPKLSHQKTQRAIAPAAKISLNPKSDRNPILTGIPLSDRFFARYAPPQSKTLHYELTDGYKADFEGQLSLFEFQVVAEPEPPDPDDFESLDAFREAIARWDREHPSSFDHCSDLPNSVHSEPPDPDDFDSMFAFWAAYDAWDKASDDDSEPLEVSLDSFCEWAPCPADWYEPAEVTEASKVMELFPIHKNSSTSDFFILTFGRWGDRSNRSDEPPDTAIFARLPKPKSPTFPPQASQVKSGQVRSSQPGIPKLFHRVAAGTSTQPARSPPGGDAV